MNLKFFFDWWHCYTFYKQVNLICRICLSGFRSQTLMIHGAAGKEREPFLFLSTTSTHPGIFRHTFETLLCIWLLHNFNSIACNYQTVTWWDLPPWRITIWLIDDADVEIWHERVVHLKLNQISPSVTSEPINQVR